MAEELPEQVVRQMAKVGLPRGGDCPFEPQLEMNFKGKSAIKRGTVAHGPKKGESGYVDNRGRVWIKDGAHAGDPGHWDVQEDDGRDYFRVSPEGNLLP